MNCRRCAREAGAAPRADLPVAAGPAEYPELPVRLVRIFVVEYVGIMGYTVGILSSIIITMVLCWVMAMDGGAMDAMIACTMTLDAGLWLTASPPQARTAWLTLAGITFALVLACNQAAFSPPTVCVPSSSESELRYALA